MSVITAEEYAARLAKLQQVLVQREIELAVINCNTDLFYYTGSLQPLYLLVPATGQALLLSRKAITRIREEAPYLALREFTGTKEMAAAINEAGFAGAKRIAYTLDTVTYATVARLQKLFPGAEVADISWEMRTLRMVKSPAELEIITRGAAILSQVPAFVKAHFLPGMTELELSATVESFLRLHGGDALIRCRKEGVEMSAFGVLSAGVNSLSGTKFDGVLGGKGLCPAVPYGASYDLIPRDVPAMLDFGFVLEGYLTDLTRMFVWGQPSDEVRRAYDAMLQIHRAVIAMLKPGITWEEPYTLAVKMAADLGYADTFMGAGPEKVKFVGHGLGLELDDPPFLAPQMRGLLEANMVLAIEPKVTLPGIGAIGPEDTVLLTEQGVQMLTTCSQEMIIV